MPAPLRRVLAPLHAPATYTRWAYLVIGGAVFVPYAMAALVLISMLMHRGQVQTLEQVPPAALAAAALPVAATGLIPGVRPLENGLTRALLTRHPLPTEPARTLRARTRTACWLLIHLTTGFAVCLATMVVLTEAALLALAPLLPAAYDPGVLSQIGPPATPAARMLAPLAALLLLAAWLYFIAALGAATARLAPALLGPSAAERLDALQRRTENLLERARLARELHDSLGHALSVVALQAATAQRLLDRDPDFARQALHTITGQARSAAAELDQVLGLLREEHPPPAPQRTLADLDTLLAAIRSTATPLTADIRGTPADVAAPISRETYRIIQEGLTNALRHAPTRAITLTLDITEEELTVEIANPAPARARRRAGRGLRGMRERVHLLGGSLHTATDDGRWRLRAAIPLRGPR